MSFMVVCNKVKPSVFYFFSVTIFCVYPSCGGTNNCGAVVFTFGAVVFTFLLTICLVIPEAISRSDDDEDEEEYQTKKSPFGSSFRTFDGTDYSNIATIDVKKSIFGLCTDSSDCKLAVIEVQKRTCKLLAFQTNAGDLLQVVAG